MLDHLRQKRLPEEAQTRGLHVLAEGEAAKILEPIQGPLLEVMESQLSEANFHLVGEDRQSNRTRSNGSQPDTPRSHQLIASMFYTLLSAFSHVFLGTPPPRTPAAGQFASTVGSPHNIIYTEQPSTELAQGIRGSSYEPSLAQTSLHSGPGLMVSQVQTHGLELRYIPTEPISCETHMSHFGNMTMGNSSQSNTGQNGQVVSHHPNPQVKDKVSFSTSNILTH